MPSGTVSKTKRICYICFLKTPKENQDGHSFPPASITAGSFYINHVDPRNIYETVAYEIDAVGLHVVGAHTGDANTTVLGYVSRDGIIHTHNCHIIDSTQSFVVRVSEVKKSDLSSVVLPLPATEFFSVGLSIT